MNGKHLISSSQVAQCESELHLFTNDDTKNFFVLDVGRKFVVGYDLREGIAESRYERRVREREMRVSTLHSTRENDDGPSYFASNHVASQLA